MRKGQISIDLIITLIAVIIVMGAFTIVLSNFQSGQEELFVKSQLNESASKLATFITSTNAINDTNFTAQTLIHKVSYKNVSLQPIPGIINSPDENYISLKVNTDNGFIEVRSFFSKPKESQVSFNGRLLVVSNE